MKVNPKELTNLFLKSIVENKVVFIALWGGSDTGKFTADLIISIHENYKYC